MLIGGLQKTTLIDFPGRVACTVFTVGCNFRCPFCHNKDLVTLNNFKKSRLPDISEQSFFEFLEKRKKILDGVCITGGEPTLQKDLTQFCQKIKELDLEVKLDTNGSNPQILEKLIKKKLVDFIAMDVKTTFEDYSKVVNFQFPISNLKKSIKLILQSGIEYEFRTTIVPGIHNKKNIQQLAKQLKQITFDLPTFRPTDLKRSYYLNYVLQAFRPQNCLNPKFLEIGPFSNKDLNGLLKSVQAVLPQTKLRGID